MDTAQPVWNGEPLSGCLLVHTEQGAGDAIQFARYLPLCAERCDRLMVVCPDHLLRLFSALPCVDECRGPGAIDRQAFDARIPLMSLPRIFGTNAHNIPAEFPYLLVPTPGRPARPRRQDQRPRVGIVWAGNSGHANDELRSCRLEDFLPVLRVGGVDFFSLQKGERAKDLERLPGDIVIADLDDRIGDYADTAALVRQMDLVISVDTSVANVAGALDVPVWVLLYYNADWRYQSGSETCPWYRSMRQIWQSRVLDWNAVLEQVSADLDPSRRKYLTDFFNRTHEISG